MSEEDAWKIKELQDELNHSRNLCFDLASRIVNKESKRIGVHVHEWILVWDSYYRDLCITEDFNRSCSYDFKEILKLLDSLPDDAGYARLIPALSQVRPVEYFLGDERQFFDLRTGKACTENDQVKGSDNNEK